MGHGIILPGIRLERRWFVGRPVRHMSRTLRACCRVIATPEGRNKLDNMFNWAAIGRLPAFARDNLRVRQNVLMTSYPSDKPGHHALREYFFSFARMTNFERYEG